MKPEQWQKIKAVFNDARGRTPLERKIFLDKVCDGDTEMRREVESLLSSFENAESFMETPPAEEFADVIKGNSKKLEKGKCFGHYEIIEQIGTGGMGEV